MLILPHTVPATSSSWQLDKLATCPPAPGTLHKLFHLEHSSTPLPPQAPVHQISASQGSVGRPLVKSLRGGFQNPSHTVTSLSLTAQQDRPLPGAQGDPLLSKPSWLSSSQADPISHVLSSVHCRISSEISPLQDSGDCLSPAAAQKSLIRTPQTGVQEQRGVGAPPRRRGRGAGRKRGHSSPCWRRGPRRRGLAGHRHWGVRPGPAVPLTHPFLISPTVPN